MQHSHRFTQPNVRIIAGDAATLSLRAALWVWFGCGLIALLTFPSLRGFNTMIGWLPFWLVIAPLIDLALLRRHWLAAASRTWLVRARRRRRPARRQARLLSGWHRRVVRLPHVAGTGQA